MAQEEGGTPPDRFLIPIPGLRVPRSWSIGSVIIHPGHGATALIATTPPFEGGYRFLRERVETILASAAHGSIAEVDGADGIEVAIERVREALDILRLFQLARSITHTTAFGLPGDVYTATIEYIAVWQNSAPGWRHLGEPIGWEFNDDAYRAWTDSRSFSFLSQAMASPMPTDGQRRAVTGARLLARAAAEHRPGFRMLGAVMALEAWLLPSSEGPQSLRLARHVTAFACRRDDGQPCGGAVLDCPYLRLDPSDEKHRKRLKKLSTIGGAWTCSEWFRVVDWYGARSDAAHGRSAEVSSSDASSATYVISHYLLDPILDWLASHPDDPTGDLARELGTVVDAASWQKMVDAIDEPTPPEMPPVC